MVIFSEAIHIFTTKHSLFSARVLGFWTFSPKEKSSCILISLTFDRCPHKCCCFHVWTEITSACCLVSGSFQDPPPQSRVRSSSESPSCLRDPCGHQMEPFTLCFGGTGGGSSWCEKWAAWHQCKWEVCMCVCIGREKVLQYDNLAKKT